MKKYGIIKSEIKGEAFNFNKRYGWLKMEEKWKFYDTILTEGARWLVMRYEKLPKEVTALGVKKLPLNNMSYGFLALARVYQVYSGEFCFGGNIFSYLYLKYIKKFKFLKRPRKFVVDYIDVDVFCKELCHTFNTDVSIIEEIYKQYYMGK